MISFLIAMLAASLMQPVRTLPPQFAVLEAECAQRCSEGGGKPMEWTIDATHGAPELVKCSCSRTTPKGVYTWHIPPANPDLSLAPMAGTAFESCTGSGTVQCSEDGKTWYNAVVVNGVSKCKPPPTSPSRRDLESRPPQPLPHARVSPSAGDLLRAHVHWAGNRWVPNVM
jgi:hypothetical protein